MLSKFKCFYTVQYDSTQLDRCLKTFTTGALVDSTETFIGVLYIARCLLKIVTNIIL